MERIILRELCFNSKKIVFNEDVNYIIGPSNSGKTIIFYLIQYILGIKDSMPQIMKPFRIDNLSLKVSFGKRIVYITREFGHNTIDFDGDIQTKAKTSSLALGDIYNELLHPSIGIQEDRMAGIEILKTAFCGETSSHSFRKSLMIFNKIIGINDLLTIQMKNEIDKFKQEIELDETTNYAIESYIGRVENSIRKEGESKLNNQDIDYVINILKKEYRNMRKESLQNRTLLQEAKDSLEKATSYNRELFTKRNQDMDSQFYKYLYEFQLTKFVRINDVFSNNKIFGSSSSDENILLKLLALMTLCRVSEYDWHNGSGLLVNDIGLGRMDQFTKECYRKIISEECRLGNLQYIEFGHDREVSNKSIVLELDYRGLLNGKEI